MSLFEQTNIAADAAVQLLDGGRAAALRLQALGDPGGAAAVDF
jgi:hypothetical protein